MYDRILGNTQTYTYYVYELKRGVLATQITAKDKALINIHKKWSVSSVYSCFLAGKV